jgi:hypothetical protein
VAEEVIVHHRASIAVSGLGKADEAFLAALVRSEFGVDDSQDTAPQLVLRAQMTHAFSTAPESVELARMALGVFDVEPDDEATRAMVDWWLGKLYGAPHHFLRRSRQKVQCRDGLD